MVPYIVRPGDHLARIAHRFGFDADKVWNDPKNADLKKLRGTGAILCSGDILYIPEPDKKWLSVKVGQNNSFTARVSSTKVKLRIAYDGEPCANTDYKVLCAGAEITGTTDGDGKLSFDAPLTAWTAVVKITGKPDIPVRIGHLDPVETDSGTIQRLRHLRYLPHAGVHGDDDTPPDWLETALPAAIARFQEASSLTATGKMDDATRQALVKAHGC